MQTSAMNRRSGIISGISYEPIIEPDPYRGNTRHVYSQDDKNNKGNKNVPRNPTYLINPFSDHPENALTIQDIPLTDVLPGHLVVAARNLPKQYLESVGLEAGLTQGHLRHLEDTVRDDYSRKMEMFASWKKKNENAKLEDLINIHRQRGLFYEAEEIVARSLPCSGNPFRNRIISDNDVEICIIHVGDGYALLRDAMGITKGELETIIRDHDGNTKKGLRRMIEDWRLNKGLPDLVTALRQAGCDDVLQKLKENEKKNLPCNYGN